MQEGFQFFSTIILVFGVIALLVGIFVIYNTFSIIVQQRTRELALLRAVGASRRQVLSAVIIEGVVVGLIGALLGLGRRHPAGPGLHLGDRRRLRLRGHHHGHDRPSRRC